MCKSRLAIDRGSVQGGVCRGGVQEGFWLGRFELEGPWVGVGLEGEEGAEADWDHS